jgi:predicted nucleic acid-binding protein
MRVVVSDTSPIHYLVLIGEVNLLAALYERIIIPSSVAAELTRFRTPEAVRQWINQPPSWLEVIVPSSQSNLGTLGHLDLGERDALLLALEAKADLVLMDDREGVEEARQLGLTVTGTLGVLDQAASENLLDLPTALDRLSATNFRVAPALLSRLLMDDAKRRK